MTPQEFTDAVWPHIVASFPSVKDKITSGFPKDRRHERTVTQSDIIDTWKRTLGPFGIDETKTAVDDLLSSDWQAPYALEEYLKAILSKVRSKGDRTYKPKGRMIDGERVFSCRVGCRDDGVIVVWHPFDHKAARERPDEFIAGSIPAYTCIIPCSCRAGNAMLHFYPKTLIRYSPDGKAIRVPEYGSMKPIEMRRQLVEILAERDATTPRRGKQVAFDCDAPGRFEDENGFPT